MDDRTIRNKITAAVQEPAAPEALIRRNIVRAQALRAGREAEEKLAQSDETLPREEKELLAAQSLLGRLMLSNLPIEGVTAEALTERIRKAEYFRKEADRPTEQLLSDLQNGKMIRRMAALNRSRNEKALSDPAAAEERQKAPVREAPLKSGPAL